MNAMEVVVILVALLVVVGLIVGALRAPVSSRFGRIGLIAGSLGVIVAVPII